MNDVIFRYCPVISEKHEPKNAIEIFVRGTVWDPEIRAGVWHIQELDVAYAMIDRLNKDQEQGNI